MLQSLLDVINIQLKLYMPYNNKFTNSPNERKELLLSLINEYQINPQEKKDAEITLGAIRNLVVALNIETDLFTDSQLFFSCNQLKDSIIE